MSSKGRLFRDEIQDPLGEILEEKYYEGSKEIDKVSLYRQGGGRMSYGVDEQVIS
jgi:hypothetical protein